MGRVIVFILTAAHLMGQEKPSVSDFAWLAGCWDGSTETKENIEQWMKPSGRMMLGMSRTLKNGKLVEYEFMKIHQDENGEIFYTAHPSGQASASFRLIKWSAQEIVFENAEHDFPQRILYHREGDRLKARIEGSVNGKEKGIDFPMKKISCD